MANEAVIVELINGGEPIYVTVADETGIEKGTFIEMTDPRTGAANNGSGDVFIGIAAAEKVASDGSTKLAVYTKGVFDLVNSDAAITVGAIVSTSGANLIKPATEAEVVAGKGIGKALETAAAAERIQVFVYPVG